MIASTASAYLSWAAERATAKDQAIAARLAEVAGADPDELFARLEAEKFNVSALGTGDLLRKDYKAWETPLGSYGMSSVPTSLENWTDKDPGLVAGLDAFLRSRGLACLGAMMAYSDDGGEFRRDLAVYAPDPALAERLTAVLQAGGLGLTRIRPAGLADSDRVMCFSQSNRSISRKKLQPLVQQFFSGQGDD